MNTDPDYKQRRLDHEQAIQAYIKAHPSADRSSGNDTIPVVVHVLHTGQAVGTTYNISDAQIQSSIDRVNEAFADYDGSGTDTGIRFALAKRDPSGCNTSTGINRINATGINNYETDGISTGTDRVDLFNLSRWNTEEYLNFWVVSEIDNNNGGSGTQGYATFSNTSHQYDGMVCMYNTVGYDPTGSLGYELKSERNQNETVIHEFGHYLDLYHTFQGDNDQTTCPTDADCGTNGDCCSDTDPHQRTYSNVCWTGVTNSCTGSYYGNVVKNYMAYSSQDCKDRFTSDQVARMQAILTTGRAGLLSSSGLKDISVSEPVAACAATTGSTGTSGNYGIGITRVKIGTWEVHSGNAYEDGGYQDNWCDHVDLAPNTTYSYEIETAGNYSEYVHLYIDYNNDGTFDVSGNELVLSTSYGSSWSGSFTTPSTVVYNTPLRMRVRGSATTANNDPCLDPTYSQAEDYAVYFDNPAELVASASTLSNLRTLSGSNAVDQTFTLSGNGLSADAKVELPGTDFELSTDGSSYSSSLTISQSGGDLVGEPVTIYARLKSSASLGTYNDEIIISSTGADTVKIAIDGEVDEVSVNRGNSLELDGSGDQVTTSLALPATYTKEAWVKRVYTSGSPNYNIVSSTTSGTHALYAPSGASYQLSAGHNGSYQVVQDSEALPTDEWVHVAVTYDAGTQVMTLYKNGFQVDQASSVANHGGSNVSIGAFNGGNHWEGEIDEVRIWSVVRTEAELRASMHLTLSGTESGLEAYWQFNEGSGSVANEPIKGYDGTLTGDADFASSSLDVGIGVYSTISLSALGSAGIEVNANNMEIDFTDGGTAPDGDLMVFELDGMPSNSPGDSYEPGKHWVIRNFGNNQTGLNIDAIKVTIDNSDGMFNYHESTMKLYKRDSGSDGSWTTVASAATEVDYSNGIITYGSLSGFNSFSQIVASSQGLVLPVSWLYFTAERSRPDEIHLEWATASESNCQDFIIEQSYDGRNFSPVGRTTCQGNLEQTTYYHQMIEESRATYFRLKQQDVDRSFSYSQIIYVAATAPSASFQIFPNPSTGLVYLQSEAVDIDEQLSLELMGTNGQRLLFLQNNLQNLNDRLNAYLSDAPKGVFLIHVQGEELEFRERLLVY
ncbi:MAG: LamG-like jellyroll fold domain-containing protein [Bacteroidota bacterium]